MVFIWNGFDSEVFLVHEKKQLSFQNTLMLLGGQVLFRGYVIGRERCYLYDSHIVICDITSDYGTLSVLVLPC